MILYRSANPSVILIIWESLSMDFNTSSRNRNCISHSAFCSLVKNDSNFRYSTILLRGNAIICEPVKFFMNAKDYEVFIIVCGKWSVTLYYIFLALIIYLFIILTIYEFYKYLLKNTCSNSTLWYWICKIIQKSYSKTLSEV